MAVETPEKTYLIRFWSCVNPASYYQFINDQYAVRLNAFQQVIHGYWNTASTPSDYLEGSWNPKAVYLPPMKRPAEYAHTDVQEVLAFSPAPANVWVRKGALMSFEYLSDGDCMGPTRICYGTYLQNLLAYDEVVAKTESERRTEKILALQNKYNLQTSKQGSYVPDTTGYTRPTSPALFRTQERLSRTLWNKILKLGIWLLAGLVLFFGGGTELYESFDITVPMLLIAYFVYAILVFVVMGFPKFLSERSFEGKIESIEMSFVTPTSLTSVGSIARPVQTQMKLVIKLEEKDGTVSTYEKTAKDSDEDLRTFYRVGYTLRHIRWAPYDQCFKDEDVREVRCVLCGINNAIENDGCSACGASLIKHLPKKQTRTF
jgi:hypothetical protein